MKTPPRRPSRTALRKAPRISYAKLQQAKDQTRDRDLKRVVSGRATAEEIRRETQAFTDEELKSFKIANFEQIVIRSR